MKYVHDTRQIAHLWMHREQDHARNAQNNFYFRDGTIYSYGSHFPIASHARTNQGEDCVIMTTRTYGNTTAKHLHLVRMAIPGNVPVFYAPWPLLATGAHEQNIASLREDVISAQHTLADAPKRRPSIAKAQRELEKAITSAVRYCEAFGTPEQVEEIKARACVNDEQLAQLRARDRAQASQIREAARLRAMAENQEYMHKAIAQLQAWKRGEAHLPERAHWYPVVLRIGNSRDCVLTSWGVMMDLKTVTRGLRLLDRLNAQGQTGERTGEKIGIYDLLAVTPEKVVIGCHHIPMSEVNWLREQLASMPAHEPEPDPTADPASC